MTCISTSLSTNFASLSQYHLFPINSHLITLRKSSSKNIMKLSSVNAVFVLAVGIVEASLNCTVITDNLNYYKCPNATCPVVGTLPLNSTAWMWCAVDYMFSPEGKISKRAQRDSKEWNGNYASGLAGRYADCWFFEQKWNTTDKMLPLYQNLLRDRVSVKVGQNAKPCFVVIFWEIVGYTQSVALEHTKLREATTLCSFQILISAKIVENQQADYVLK
ncbi:hypothetical protein B0J14DRAFT_664686 [Halenospora varia]|nr:hypothetical protein B0J14DRAFT_664686 [Halenospora varia]